MHLSLSALTIVGLSLCGTVMAAAMPEPVAKAVPNHFLNARQGGSPGVRSLPELAVINSLIKLYCNRDVPKVPSVAIARIRTAQNIVPHVDQALGYVRY